MRRYPGTKAASALTRLAVLSMCAIAAVLIHGSFGTIPASADIDGGVGSMLFPVASASTWHISCGYDCHQRYLGKSGPQKYAIDVRREQNNGTSSIGVTVISPIKGRVSRNEKGYRTCGRDSVVFHDPAGAGVVIDAVAGDGSTMTGYSIHLVHVSPSVHVGDLVYEGQPIGTIANYPDATTHQIPPSSCAHLHIYETFSSDCRNHRWGCYGNPIGESLKLAGRPYSHAYDGTPIRNNTLTSATSFGGAITYVGLKDPVFRTQTEDPFDRVGDNNAESAGANEGCTMRLYNGVNFNLNFTAPPGVLGHYDVTYVVQNLGTVGFANLPSSASVFNCSPG